MNYFDSRLTRWSRDHSAMIIHDGARYIKEKSWMRRIIPRKPATRASTIKERAPRINTEGLSQSILKFRVLFAARPFLSRVLPRLLILLFQSWIMPQITSKIIDIKDYITIQQSYHRIKKIYELKIIIIIPFDLKNFALYIFYGKV